jgi:hypothetical protein
VDIDMKFDFEFLAWFERAAFFRDRAKIELDSLCKKLEIDDIWSYCVYQSSAFKEKGSIVALYQELLGCPLKKDREEGWRLLDAWLDSYYEHYKAMNPRNERMKILTEWFFVLGEVNFPTYEFQLPIPSGHLLRHIVVCVLTFEDRSFCVGYHLLDHDVTMKELLADTEKGKTLRHVTREAALKQATTG